jgi:hypothetical protein
VVAVTAFLATVATIPTLATAIDREGDGVRGAQEGWDGATSVACTTEAAQSAARAAPDDTRASVPRTAPPRGDGADAASMGESGSDRAGTPPAGAAPDCPGGGA